MAKTILVTGSNGQLGKSLRTLAENDDKNHWVFSSRQDLDITKKESIKAATGDIIFLEKKNGITRRVNFVD